MRDLTAEFITHLTAARNRPAFFYEGVFVGFTLQLWSGIGSIVWDGKTWLGNGWLQPFKGIEESDDLGSTGMEITLAGVPQSLISTMLGSAMQNANGKLWFGFIDDAGDVVDAPYLMFHGRLDVPTIDDKADGPIIQISYESKLIDLDRSQEFRYTPESHKIFNPTDRGFEYTAQLAKGWKNQWGANAKKIKKKQDREEARRKKGGGKRGGKDRK